MPEPIPLAGIPPAEEGLLGAPDVSLQSPAAEKVGAQGRDTDGGGEDRGHLAVVLSNERASFETSAWRIAPSGKGVIRKNREVLRIMRPLREPRGWKK